MSIMNNFKAVASVSAVVFLGACADMPPPANTVTNIYPQTSSARVQYGVVQSIDLIAQSGTPAGNIGIGTIAGAVVGGILGHQVGGGSGNTAATVLGAAGGAYAGHNLEKRNDAVTTSNAFRFTVRLNDGTYQAITQTSNADIRVGDRVLIDNGTVRRY